MTGEPKDKKKQYDLEPVDEPKPEVAPEVAPDIAPEVTPADAAVPDPDSIKALDVCPNCGAPMGSVDVVVCMRCGFDLKALKVIKTAKGTDEKAADESQEEAAPLSAPGVGDKWLPLAMAIASVVVLTIGYLAGNRGLITVAPEEAVGFMARFEGLFKMLVRVSVMTLSGVGGLYFLAHMLETRMGELRLAAIRMLGVVAAVSLLNFFNVSSDPLEWTIEAITQALGFVGLAMVLYGLTIRDAATLLGVTIFALIGALAVSALVLWAAPPS